MGAAPEWGRLIPKNPDPLHFSGKEGLQEKSLFFENSWNRFVTNIIYQSKKFVKNFTKED